MSSSTDTATPRDALVTSAVAVGLGAGALLATLAPLRLPVAAGTGLGVLLGLWSLSAEAAVAAEDLARGRSPLRRVLLLPSSAAATLSTLLAAIAVVHAAWAFVALVHLAADGTAATTDKGIAAWMGTEQGFAGLAGLQGSAILLACTAAASVLGVALAARCRAGALLTGLLLASLALSGAAGVAMWMARTAPIEPLLAPAAGPASAMELLLDLGLGTCVGVLAVGAGTGAVHALRRRGRIGPAKTGLLARLLPLACTGLLALACWPAADLLGEAALGAPAPFGRQAAAVLLAPPPLLGTAAWQGAWFLGLLLAGFAGAIVFGQPALGVLREALAVGPRAATTILTALVCVVALAGVLLPGTLEALCALAAALLVAQAGSWLVLRAADASGGAAGRLGRALAGALCAPLAVGAGLALSALPPAWREDALVGNGRLGLLLGVALLAWWLVLHVAAALRARRVRLPGRAAPAPRRTRA